MRTKTEHCRLEITNKSTNDKPKYIGKILVDNASEADRYVAQSEAALVLQLIAKEFNKSPRDFKAVDMLIDLINTQSTEFWLEEISTVGFNRLDLLPILLPLFIVFIKNPVSEIMRDALKLVIQKIPSEVLVKNAVLNGHSGSSIFSVLCLHVQHQPANNFIKELLFEAQKKVRPLAYAGYDSGDLKRNTLVDSPLRHLILSFSNDPENELLLKIADLAIDNSPDSALINAFTVDEEMNQMPLLSLMLSFAHSPLNVQLQRIVLVLAKKLPLEYWVTTSTLLNDIVDYPLRQLLTALLKAPEELAVEEIIKVLIEKITKKQWLQIPTGLKKRDSNFLILTQLMDVIKIQIEHNARAKPFAQPESLFNLTLFGVWKNPSSTLCVLLFQSAMNKLAVDTLEEPVELVPVIKGKKQNGLSPIKTGFSYLLEAVKLAIPESNCVAKNFIQHTVALYVDYFSKMTGEWGSLLDDHMQINFFSTFIPLFSDLKVVDMLCQAIDKTPIDKLSEIKSLFISHHTNTLLERVKKAELKNKGKINTKTKSNVAIDRKNVSPVGIKKKPKVASKNKANVSDQKKEEETQQPTMSKLKVVEEQSTLLKSDVDDFLEPGYVLAPSGMVEPLLGVTLWSDLRDSSRTPTPVSEAQDNFDKNFVY